MPGLVRTMVVGMTMVLLVGCGYNDLQGLDENVKAAWSEVQNQYQRRADLIPNLVNVVKGYAAHERETLEAVTEARAKVGSVQVTPQTLNDPQSFKQFEEAQAGLTSALSRLMVVVEASNGQLEDEMRLALSHAGVHRLPEIRSVRRFGGVLPQQDEIVEAVVEAARPRGGIS